MEAAGTASREELSMFRYRDRRMVAGLVVMLVLALPWSATAARLPVSDPERPAIQALAPLEALRSGFWGWLRGVWTKEGCGLDPGGKPACGTTSATVPEAPMSNADVGCSLDPGGSPCGGRQ
jgi:hypothetical protein